MIKDWKSDEFVLLEKNERYWGEKSSVSQIRFETVPDFEKRIVGLIEGTIDILPMLEPSALENKLMLQEAEKLRVQSIPGLMLLYLGMDVFREKTPYVDLPKNPFRDIRVRKAVYQAINIQSIVRDILKGHGTAATQLVAPNVFGHNDRIQRPAYDPKAARELLMQAGYLNGFRVRLDITNNRYRDDIEIGRAIVRDLEAVGIQVQLNAIDKDILFRKRDLRDTSFYMAGWMDSSADALSTFDFLIHTPDPKRNYGTANGAGYSNPEVDRLVERSSEELVPSSRISLLEKAMELTMQDLAFIPLHVENNVTATANHIQWRLRSDELVNASDIHLQQEP